MLLTVHTLPQLAVSAKLLCLLMMVICGAVPSVVRSVRLYNECSHGYMQIDANGTVRAESSVTDNRWQNLSISSIDRAITLKIYGEASGMYLCFTKNWKLVGKKKFVKKRCTFKERLENAYTQYYSPFDTNRYMGFTARGRPVRGACDASKRKHKQRCGCCSRKRGCGPSFMFLRPGSNEDIRHHNAHIRNGGWHSSHRQRPSS